MGEYFVGDNLYWLKQAKLAFRKVDLIYIDPPFNSKRSYFTTIKSNQSGEETQQIVFDDTWLPGSYEKYSDELKNLPNISLYKFLSNLRCLDIPESTLTYLANMAIRIYYMHQILNDTGNFYIHCDPGFSHYLKLLCDLIFGVKNYQNEIVWAYNGGATGKKRFPKKHDTILRYSKTDKFTHNILYKPYADSTQKVGKHSTLSKNDTEIDLDRGTPITDWWDDIGTITGWSPEDEGYPTQKPLNLLKRIIESSSNEGDIVADFYLGGGTTLVAARSLNRDWIGVDSNSLAITTTQKRMERETGSNDFEVGGIPLSSNQLIEMINDHRKNGFDIQDIVCKYFLKEIVVPNGRKSGDGGKDGSYRFFWKDKWYQGAIQVTIGSDLNHFYRTLRLVEIKEVDVATYICFKNNITEKMRTDARRLGKVTEGWVDKFQFLTFEDLIDNKKIIQIPIGASWETHTPKPDAPAYLF